MVPIADDRHIIGYRAYRFIVLLNEVCLSCLIVFHTDISANLEIPAAPFRLKNATGRVDLTEREANWRKNDFELMENCMSEQEMAQECSRCLRCDHYGHAGFKGGRLVKW